MKLYPEVVKPASSGVPIEISSNPRRWPAFKDCVGALDGSHFPLHVPVDQQRSYRNRHGDISQNVLAVVDFRMNFTHILGGWEGSAHDGRVLKDAVDRGFDAPSGRYYLADAGYANSDILLCPYRGVRYHLREISQASHMPETREELFNYRHSSLRNVVERTFGVFKRRWRIFDRPHEFSIRTQVKLVYALAAVHNHINLHYPVNKDFDELELYAGEESERVQRKAENEENISVFDSEMSERREIIADMLWEQYCRRDTAV